VGGGCTPSNLERQLWQLRRNRPIEGEHPYVYLDGIVLRRSWAGEVRTVSLLVAIGVNGEGYREILGICEGANEDKAGWSGFLKHLKERALRGVRLIINVRFSLLPRARCRDGSLALWLIELRA
jgi:transposase-like protein